MQGGVQQRVMSGGVLLFLVALMVFTPLSPMASLFSMEADAAAGRAMRTNLAMVPTNTLPSIRGLTPTSAPRFRCQEVPWSRMSP